MEQEYKLVQFEMPELDQANAHGNFRVGQIKESEIVNLHKINNKNEIEALIEDFLSSGSRIEVLQAPETMTVQELRNMISSKLLHLSQYSPMYRRVIVREYDNVLYLARRAFWDGKRLPITYSNEDEIKPEIKQVIGTTTGNKLKHINRSTYRLPLPTGIKEMSEEEIKDWEEIGAMNTLWHLIEPVIDIRYSNSNSN